MKVAIFSAHPFELDQLKLANKDKHELRFINAYLTAETAVLAQGCECVALFSNDDASAPALNELYKLGIKYIALRSAGFNHVDLEHAKVLGMHVAHVPSYSPYSVAEHTVTLMLALNRKIVQANSRIKELNFSLDNLTGFDMNGKTVGVIGTGKIGKITAKILQGFGCNLMGYDLQEDEELSQVYGMVYTDVDTICEKADIITLHVPLNQQTKYIIDTPQINKMKKGVMLINTSRGGLLNTKAVIESLKTGHIGYLGLDVYEQEKGLFFEDHSEDILLDDVIARLMTFKNVLITSHQAFLTHTALKNIADATIENIDSWEEHKEPEHLLV